MAPINFEDNIREKLEGREIQPSTSAWKKLSTQLDGADEKRGATSIWYTIAASFIGILILTSVFFNQTKSSEEGKTELVDADSLDKPEIKEIPIVNSLVNSSEEFAETSIFSEEKAAKDQQKKAIQKKRIEVPTQFIKKIDQNIDAIAKANVSSQKRQEDSNPVASNDSKEDLIMNTRIAELVAGVEGMQQSNTAISSEEIEVLLATAQREIQTQRILNSTKVDPAALLGDVEFELEQSFRDKVFNALGDSYLFIRTAVVERNN
jgi:hypothetical protein